MLHGGAPPVANPARIPNSDRPTPEKERVGGNLLVAEGSIIPGESEEDGLIRKEYVLVDPRAVEFTRAVDGMFNSLLLSCNSCTLFSIERPTTATG